MKPLFAVLALMLCLVAHAAPIDDVKAAMDAPVKMTAPLERRSPSDAVTVEDRKALEKMIQRERTQRGFEATPRELLGWLSQTQGRTSTDLILLNNLAKSNASILRKKLLPLLKEAGMTSASSDLEEALKLVDAGKTLGRPAQDRFARLAKVAP